MSLKKFFNTLDVCWSAKVPFTPMVIKFDRYSQQNISAGKLSFVTHEGTAHELSTTFAGAFESEHAIARFGKKQDDNTIAINTHMGDNEVTHQLGYDKVQALMAFEESQKAKRAERLARKMQKINAVAPAATA